MKKLSISTDWETCPLCKNGKVIPFERLSNFYSFETWKVKCNKCGIEYPERFCK